MTTDEHLAAIHIALVESPIVADYTVVRQRVTSQTGYLRVRVRLSNGDFLEAAEAFRLRVTGVEVIDYRHQWMDGDQTIMRKRWDSSPHHPELDNFPHHCHDGNEDHVIPSKPLSIQDVLRVIAQEVTADSSR